MIKKLCALVLLGTLCCACQKQPVKKQALTKKQEEIEPMPQPKISSTIKKALLVRAQKDMPKPGLGNTVLVHYTGWLAKDDHTPGKQIDSSIERKTPLQFTVGLHQVIRGFEESVMLMHVGEKSRFIIPSDLAYGEHGVGLFIPPNAALIFDIELLAMK